MIYTKKIVGFLEKIVFNTVGFFYIGMVDKVSFFSKEKSLRSEFILLAVTIALIVTTMLLAFSWRVYQLQSVRIHDRLDDTATRMDQALTYSLDYTANLMEGLMMQIRKHPSDIESIDRLLSAFRVNHRLNLVVSWNMFSWIDKYHQVLVNSRLGKLPEPFSAVDSYPIDLAVRIPGKIHLGNNLIGPAGNHQAIPAVFGGFENNEYIGSIGISLNVQGIADKLKSVIKNQGIEFILLDDNMQFITSSTDDREEFFDLESVLGLLKNQDFSKKQSVELLTPTLLNNANFLYAHHLERYPYYVVLSYDKNIRMRKLLEALFPRIVECLVIGSFLILLLFVVNRRIVQPIGELSLAANLIAKGEDVTPPVSRWQHKEILDLTSHLSQVVNYIQELKHVKEELIEKTNAAESANRAKSEFLACVSHELRTPLSTIIGYAEMIKQELFGKLGNQKYHQYASDIYSAGLTLLRIINDILDIYKLESGMVHLRMEYIKINELLEASIDELQLQAKKGNIFIFFEPDPHLPLLYADKMRIKQILHHILSNAIKFTPENGEVRIDAYIVSKNEQEYACISISDTGIGMLEEDITKAFISFTQVDGGINRKFEGTGLGLPLAKKLITLHGGDLIIESEVNKGTNAMILLPLHDARSNFMQSLHNMPREE